MTEPLLEVTDLSVDYVTDAADVRAVDRVSLAVESGNVWWVLAPGFAVALMGAGFALLNYAFDEIGNPALRPVRRRTKNGRHLLGRGRDRSSA